MWQSIMDKLRWLNIQFPCQNIFQLINDKDSSYSTVTYFQQKATGITVFKTKTKQVTKNAFF